jgi:thiol-disulfide isomerase/thioredoxin/mono/diheme cytochrome c family protein
MKKIGLAIILVLIVRADALRAEGAAESVREGPVVVAPRENGVGERIQDISFMDLDGKTGKLSDFKDKKSVVICMTSASCPVARKYGPTLVELQKQYGNKGVAFLAINVGVADSIEKVKAAEADFKKGGWTERYVFDHDGRLAGVLGATSTTEVFVLDRARTLVYRGAADDQYGLGYVLPEARHHYLINALESTLSDEPVLVASTSAPGCVLAAAGKATADAKLTYHNRISRIVQGHCLECHRKGENGPFELTTYDDVKGNSAMIKKVVGKKTMPPWFADAKAEHPFKNDRSLSERDRNDITKWVEAGCPEGDKAEAPVALKFAVGWRIGKPDLILESPVVQSIPAQGTIPYQYVLVQNTMTEDKWISAMEVRPSTPEVVHHLLVFLAFPPGDPRSKGALRDFGGGLKGYFAGMVPGQGHITFPEGTAKLLPKGATLIFQIHYTANGKAAQDRPQIGFKFAESKPEFEVVTHAASNKNFQIPPNDPNYKIEARYTFKEPTRLLSVNPHSHVRGKAFKYELYPDGNLAGKADVLLDLPRYDFNWQIEHQFAKPVDVPAGAVLVVTGWYDNSKDNPANPDPSRAVRFGEQTWNEMMIGYFTGHPIKSADGAAGASIQQNDAR